MPRYTISSEVSCVFHFMTPERSGHCFGGSLLTHSSADVLLRVAHARDLGLTKRTSNCVGNGRPSDPIHPSRYTPPSCIHAPRYYDIGQISPQCAGNKCRKGQLCVRNHFEAAEVNIAQNPDTPCQRSETPLGATGAREPESRHRATAGTRSSKGSRVSPTRHQRTLWCHTWKAAHALPGSRPRNTGHVPGIWLCAPCTCPLSGRTARPPEQMSVASPCAPRARLAERGPRRPRVPHHLARLLDDTFCGL